MIKLKLLIIFFLLLVIPVSRIFAQETTVTVSGRVFDKTTQRPVGVGLAVETCPLNGRTNPIIGQDGDFSFTIPRLTSFCVRGPQSIGYSSFEAVNKTPTATSSITYEWQVSGLNCNAATVEGITCGSAEKEDRAIDTGFDLAFVGASASSSPCPLSSENLVRNGGFEEPVILNAQTNNTWKDYQGAESIPGWDPQHQDAPYQVELQARGLYGTPAQGNQYAEIDVPNNIILTQQITTTAGSTYELKFAYFPRPVAGNQKLGVYWNNQLLDTISGTGGPAGSALNWQYHTYTVPATGSTSTLGFGSLENQPGAGNFIDDVSLTQKTCQNSAQPSPSPSSSSAPALSETVSYRVAASESGLDSAQFLPYNQEPLITNFTLADSTPGFKQIWVEFKSVSGETKKEHISIELANIAPAISSLSCTVDLSRQNLKVEVVGANLGNRGGKLMSDDTNLDILEWKDNSVTGILKKPSLPTDDTQTFNIKLKTQNDVDLPPVPCRVDTSMIALGAKIFCRDQGNFEVPNVKVTLKDQNDTKAEETVTIDKNGSITGLKSKLQSGKVYLLSIKAPHSLRRNAFFRATTGTTVATNQDGSPFILPIGDIAPVNGPDGTINTADRAVLTQQWLSSKSASKNLSADFNNDQRVNSFDWACMRYDFGKSDDKKADLVSLSCGKPPFCNGELITGDPGPNDPLQCPQYSCQASENNLPQNASPSPSPVSNIPSPSPAQQISFVSQPVVGSTISNSADLSFKTNVCPTRTLIICDNNYGSADLTVTCTNGSSKTNVGSLSGSKNYTCSLGVFLEETSAANSNNFMINTP